MLRALSRNAQNMPSERSVIYLCPRNSAGKLSTTSEIIWHRSVSHEPLSQIGAALVRPVRDYLRSQGLAKIYVMILPSGKVARHPMTDNLTDKRALAIICGLALSISGSVVTTAEAIEPEKQPIYSNTIGGLLCGSASTSQCKVPAGQRLIIEHVSGFVFEPVSPKLNTVVSMVVTDPGLGLNRGQPMCSLFLRR